MQRFFLIIVGALMALTMFSQVTTTPAVIEKGYTGQVIITFDPTAGNGGMASATKCYCHTGLITSASSSTSDWKNVVSSWRAANSPQLTKVDSKWQLTIPDIYTFYGVSTSTDITALAFVFHDGPGGSKEGKSASGGDILVFIGEENSSSDIWDGFTPSACQTAVRPAGVVSGIYYDESDPTSVTLCTYAASKTAPAQHVFVLGDMTDWKLSNQYQMKRDGNYFWIKLTDLVPGQEYRFQYAVIRADGVKKQISDLYSEKVIHPDDVYEPKTVDPDFTPYPMKGADGGYVSVFQTNKPKYQWSAATTNFVRPDKNNLVIYELWVYDYTPERSIPGLMKRLDYLQNLGVNAVELMPVCEFDGNYNWGYSPNHYFALDRAYGTPEMYKAFIDSCHARGMAVIMDMVFNHATGLNPMNKLYPYGADLSSNPWFNVTAPHSDNVYEDWNHDFQPAHEMFVRALKYWLTEYKVDGYRMDLSHGFCGENCNQLMNTLADYYTNGVQAASPGAYFILEHWGSSMGSQRPTLVNQGMLCWNNTGNAYCQTAMGWLKEGDSFADANKDGYVSYTCSHDEERPFYKAKKWGNGLIKTDESVRLGRIAQNVAFNVLLNGPHMIWQYEEIGYDFSINSAYGKPNGTSSDDRCSKKERPESYGYFKDVRRMGQYAAIAQICQLRTRIIPSVFEGNPTAVSISSGASVRTVQWGSDVFAAANFNASDPQTVTLPSGSWYNYLQDATSSINGGSTITLLPGEIYVFTGVRHPLPVIKTDYAAFSSDIEDLPGATISGVEKVLMDGRVFIKKDGLFYDALGRQVK